MSSGWITYLNREAAPGSIVRLTIGGNSHSTTVVGEFIEILEGGVILLVDGKKRFIQPEVVVAVDVDAAPLASDNPKSQRAFGTVSAADSSPRLKSVSVDLNSSVSNIAGRQTKAQPILPCRAAATDTSALKSPVAKTSDHGESPYSASKPDEIPKELFDQFVGEVVIESPRPDFARLQKLPQREDQSEIIKWKNRYDYALRVKDPSSIRSSIAEIERNAMRIRSDPVLAIAGHLALYIEDWVRAKKLYSMALPAMNKDVAIGLAKVAVFSKNWELATSSLSHALIAIESGETDSDRDLLISLGRCLTQMANLEVPGLCAIARNMKTEACIRTARLLLAYALYQEHPEAARLAFNSDLSKSHQLAPDSPAFKNLKIPKREISKAAPHQTKQSNSRYEGVITSFDGAKGNAYGFVEESSKGERFFFHLGWIIDFRLENSLRRGLLNQTVSFLPDRNVSGSEKFGRARKMQLIKDGSAPKKTRKSRSKPVSRTANKEKSKAKPKKQVAATFYNQAKRADTLGRLQEAEDYYWREIETNGSDKLRSVKDLAQLYGRQGKLREALNLLDKHRNDFPDKDKRVDNQRVELLRNAGRFKEAIKLLRNMLNGADKPTQLSLQKREAYCLYMTGDFDEAIEILKKSQLIWKGDASVTKMLSTVQKAKSDNSKSFRDELLGIADWPSEMDVPGINVGLSALSRFVLDNCELRGVDDRARSSGKFQERDFRIVEEQYRDLRGRKSREKADYQLSLASMAEQAPEAAGNLDMREHLRLAFQFMGEDSIIQKLHKDVTRCYLTEAMQLARSERETEMAITYTLVTYLTTQPEYAELFEKGGRYVSTNDVLNLFQNDPEGWQRFVADFPYYSVKSILVASYLTRRISDKGLKLFESDRLLEAARGVEQDRLTKEIAEIEALINQTITPGWTENMAELFGRLSGTTRFDLDKQRLRELKDVAMEARKYLMENDYFEKQLEYERIQSRLKMLKSEIAKKPTGLSIERMDVVCSKVANYIEANFNDYQKSVQPILKLASDVDHEHDYYIPEADTVRVKLCVTSATGGAPIEGFSVALDESGEATQIESCDSDSPLRAGERRPIELWVRPTSQQLLDEVFTIEARLDYISRAGQTKTSGIFQIPIRIGKPGSFTEIDNPYENYEGGNEVEEKEMFYGRNELMERIHHQVTTGPLGQCFVLYGQKRSGKSSVLAQLRRHIIKPPNFAVLTTIGELATNSNSEHNFVRILLDGLREQCEDEYGLIVPNDWPTLEEISIDSMRSLKIGIRMTQKLLAQELNWDQPRIIFLIDEFSYLYEYIKERIIEQTFMRQWKALLQRKIFSAVIVGQDSMPLFKRDYPNEFGRTKDERISYLTQAEAKGLAETPILNNGKTRFRGEALNRLVGYTAGSPFFMQIFCAQLVRHLNEHKATMVTEWDIESVVHRLVAGENRLDEERFDSLITVAGESVARFERDTYRRILSAIARNSSSTQGVDIRELEYELADLGPESNVRDIVAELLNDMVSRDVIKKSESRYSIRVGLFAEWMRHND